MEAVLESSSLYRGHKLAAVFFYPAAFCLVLFLVSSVVSMEYFFYRNYMEENELLSKHN